MTLSYSKLLNLSKAQYKRQQLLLDRLIQLGIAITKCLDIQ